MKRKLIFIVLTFIFILTIDTHFVYSKAHAHISHTTSHASSHTASSAKTSTKTTIKGYKAGTGKTYTTPSSFKGKYNSSNIKTTKVNSNPSSYTKYSTTNMFRPNFWTAMWAFNCMNNNTQEASEQDISKELEERGYSQEEIKDILKEGEEAKIADEDQQKAETIILIIILTIVFLFIGIGIFLSMRV